MVRLKEKGLDGGENTIVFQFLMVRLKETKHIKKLESFWNFNSLWFD